VRTISSGLRVFRGVLVRPAGMFDPLSGHLSRLVAAIQVTS
jgi:hypothetical protein